MSIFNVRAAVALALGVLAGSAALATGNGGEPNRAQGKSFQRIATVANYLNNTPEQFADETVAEILAASKDGKTLLILAYETSRLAVEKSEESQPDVSNFQVSTSLLLEDGKTVLAGGSHSATGSFLVVSIK